MDQEQIAHFERLFFSRNVQTVAAGSEEMGASIREIALIVALGEWPAMAPVSPRQKSAYSLPSTSTMVAPCARSR